MLELREVNIVFLLCKNADFTTLKNCSLCFISIFITLESIFGDGKKHLFETLKRIIGSE